MAITRTSPLDEALRRKFDPGLRARARKVVEMLAEVLHLHEQRVLGDREVVDPTPIDWEELVDVAEAAILGKSRW